MSATESFVKWLDLPDRERAHTHRTHQSQSQTQIDIVERTCGPANFNDGYATAMRMFPCFARSLFNQNGAPI